jgi:hypothetical protein
MRNDTLTTEIFIKKAHLKHNNIYDYSKTEYTGRKRKLIIICKIHGEFEQRAGNHLQGQGCKLCGLERMSDKIKCWTENDDAFIKENYLKNGASYCANVLNKTLNSIYHRVKILKLKKNSKKLNHPFISGRMWSNLISNSKNRKINLEITPDDIYEKYTQQNKKCALSGLDLSLTFDAKTNTVSVDRIDSKKHYTKDNIQIVHKIINQCKMDLSDCDFYKFCKSVYLNLKQTYENKTTSDER